jgi:hypothetical protein
MNKLILSLITLYLRALKFFDLKRVLYSIKEYTQTQALLFNFAICEIAFRQLKQKKNSRKKSTFF